MNFGIREAPHGKYGDMNEIFWKGKRVFITGGSGFIGGAVAKRILDAGVFSLTLLEHDETIRYSDYIIRGDVADYSTIERAIFKHAPNIVFHLAAQPLVGIANRNPRYTFNTNIQGTYNLLEACRRAREEGIVIDRIIVASTDHVYGDGLVPYTETSHLEGVFPYDVSKVCADQITQCYQQTYGMKNICITRCSNVYGEGDITPSRIIPGTIQSLLRGEIPIIRSDGTLVRDYVYIKDIVAGYIALAEHDYCPELSCVNLCSGRTASVLSLVNMIIFLMTEENKIFPAILNSSNSKREIKELILSSEKSKRLLQWEANTSLEDGLTQTIEWWKLK